MLKQLSFSFALVALMFTAQAQPASAQSIVDIAVGDENFSSLVDAVVSQDLAETLASGGPFTVFAPTNDAFANLPSYVGDVLAEEPELLTDILLYHVVGDELFSGEVLDNRTLTSLQGERLRVNADHSNVFINSSKITALDIDADNGVVHVIDRVLLPRSVYQAVVEDLYHQIRELRDQIRDVRHDYRANKSM